MADSLDELMREHLMDIYDAEKQASKALPRMQKAASSPEVKRLEQIFEKLGMQPRSKECRGMQGLVAEAEEHMAEEMQPEFRDAALVSAEQKAEHYEIAAYSAAQELAGTLGNKLAARLLKQTLGEEQRMSRKLQQISTRWLRKTSREEQRAQERAA